MHPLLQFVLVHPDIPQNVGACIRLAACFEATMHVVEPCGFPFGPASWRRVAMDYESLTAPRRHASWTEFQASASGRTILFTTRGEIGHAEVAYQSGDILMFGSESAGAPKSVRDAADLRVRIPIAKDARSLNLATAVAVGLAEARRQLGGLP